MGFLMKKKIVERGFLMWTLASIVCWEGCLCYDGDWIVYSANHATAYLDCVLMGEFLEWRDGIWSHQKRVTLFG